jgi:2-dehydropantoate 2-reductase
LKKAIEKIAIIGAGALGATYGSLLYEQDPESVCIIASGNRYRRLNRDGVTVNGRHYALTVVRPEEVSSFDLLIRDSPVHSLYG